MRETGTHLWYVARFGIICTILKNVKNTHGGVLLLLKLQASAHGTKLLNAPHFFRDDHIMIKNEKSSFPKMSMTLKMVRTY